MFDPKTRILIVDDMQTIRRVLKKICNDLGFMDITEVADGEAAWDAINNANPPIELVLSDWIMPKLSGPELVKRIRADARYKLIPVLLITSESESHQIVNAAASGVDEYIVKPFNAEILLAKLKKAYEKHKK